MKQSLYTTIVFALLASLIACSAKPIAPTEASLISNGSECVVLVHGLWRSGFAMRSIASDLEDYGFHTVSIDYPSTEMEIPELTKQYLPDGIQHCKETGAQQIHLVTHSMGGILARQYLQSNTLPEGSKVVMLSPPNQGSKLSEKFGEYWWYQWMTGPAAISLTQKEDGIINRLQAVNEPIGIIAAYREWSLWPESWLPSPNDGTVSVESMQLTEMDDLILINSGHATMRYQDEIQQQIRHFLVKGSFLHPQVAHK